jgi:hypothetical protein
MPVTMPVIMPVNAVPYPCHVQPEALVRSPGRKAVEEHDARHAGCRGAARRRCRRRPSLPCRRACRGRLRWPRLCAACLQGDLHAARLATHFLILFFVVVFVFAQVSHVESGGRGRRIRFRSRCLTAACAPLPLQCSALAHARLLPAVTVLQQVLRRLGWSLQWVWRLRGSGRELGGDLWVVRHEEREAAVDG